MSIEVEKKDDYKYYPLSYREQEHEELTREKICDNSCGHFDSINSFCWVLWDYVSEGERCKRK